MLFLEIPVEFIVPIPVPVPGHDPLLLEYHFWLGLPVPIPGLFGGAPIWVPVPMPEPHLEQVELVGVATNADFGGAGA